MIVTPGPLDAPAGRLLAALEARGETVVDAAAVPAGTEPVTLVVSTGHFVFDFAGMVTHVAPRPFRVIVLSRLGAHPDAKAEGLKRLWRIEEHVRRSGAPTLTLRLAPLVGAASPFWRMLRTAPSLPRQGRAIVCPVAESDAVETLARAVRTDAGPPSAAAFHDWYEVAGPDAMSLAELRELARQHPGPREGAAWEPSLEEIAEHRLAECEPWATAFQIVPTPIASEVARWVA